MSAVGSISIGQVFIIVAMMLIMFIAGFQAGKSYGESCRPR